VIRGYGKNTVTLSQKMAYGKDCLRKGYRDVQKATLALANFLPFPCCYQEHAA
jgi:hypothetical protein